MSLFTFWGLEALKLLAREAKCTRKLKEKLMCLP